MLHALADDDKIYIYKKKYDVDDAEIAGSHFIAPTAKFNQLSFFTRVAAWIISTHGKSEGQEVFGAKLIISS